MSILLRYGVVSFSSSSGSSSSSSSSSSSNGGVPSSDSKDEKDQQNEMNLDVEALNCWRKYYDMIQTWLTPFNVDMTKSSQPNEDLFLGSFDKVRKSKSSLDKKKEAFEGIVSRFKNGTSQNLYYSAFQDEKTRDDHDNVKAAIVESNERYRDAIMILCLDIMEMFTEKERFYDTKLFRIDNTIKRLSTSDVAASKWLQMKRNHTIREQIQFQYTCEEVMTMVAFVKERLVAPIFTTKEIMEGIVSVNGSPYSASVAPGGI